MMNRRKLKAIRLMTVALVVAVVFALATLPLLQAQSGLSLLWSNISSGYGISQGDGFTVAGTSGEVDGGAAQSGDGLTMTGGFWSGVDEPPPYLTPPPPTPTPPPSTQFHIYLPSTIDR